MNRVKYFAILAMVGILASAAYAVDVNVDSTQPEVAGSTYQTIGAALTYVASQAAPRTIHIVAGGPYAESLQINISVTIEGDSYRPVIVTPPISGSPGPSSIDGSGVGIYTDASSGGDITVILKNLVILPAVGNAPSRGIRTNNNDGGNLTTDQMKLGLVDVLVTSNNGSDEPVTGDGLSQADLTGATIWGGDSVYVTGYCDLACTGTIVSNSYNLGDTTTRDGILFYPDVAGHTLFLGPGCVVSYMSRIGIQVATSGSIVRMKGTADAPIVFKGNHAGGAGRNGTLAIYQSNFGVDDQDYELDYVQFLENNTAGIWCYYAGSYSIPRLTATHCAFVNNTNAAIWDGDNLTEPWVFKDCTFVNNGIGGGNPPLVFPQVMIFQESIADASTGSVSFIDCIVAGNGSSDATGGANTIENDTNALAINFQNCDIPLLGPYSLAQAFTYTGSAPAATLANSLVSDPMLLDVNNYSSSQWLGVDNGSFATAASDGGPLHGYGPFVGSYVITGAKGTWTLYE